VQFRLIDIQVAKIDANDDPVQAARDLTKDLMGKLQAGEDFGELARSIRTIIEAPSEGCGRRWTRTRWLRRTTCWPRNRAT